MVTQAGRAMYPHLRGSRYVYFLSNGFMDMYNLQKRLIRAAF